VGSRLKVINSPKNTPWIVKTTISTILKYSLSQAHLTNPIYKPLSGNEWVVLAFEIPKGVSLTLYYVHVMYYPRRHRVCANVTRRTVVETYCENALAVTPVTQLYASLINMYITHKYTYTFSDNPKNCV